MQFELSHKAGYSGTYFEGSKPSTSDFIDNGNYNFLGLQFRLGLTDRIRAQLGLGYFVNKTQNYAAGLIPARLKGYGLTDLNLDVIINFARIEKHELNFFTGLGTKIPFGSGQKKFDGIAIPIDLQPTTGAVDFVHQFFITYRFNQRRTIFLLSNQLELKGRNKLEYHYGNFVSTALYLSQLIKSKVSLSAQLRTEFRARDSRPSSGNGIQLSNGREAIYVSGSRKLIFSPSVAYLIGRKWRISLVADLPIYQYYNSKQLGNSFAFMFSILRNIKGKQEAL